MKERAPQNGFTLFEVLMTLAIMAVLFSILYMVFHESMAVMASAEEQTEIVQEGRLILEKMTGELKAVFFTFRESTPRSFQYGLVGRSGMERGNFTDRLDFTALTPPFADLREDGGEILEVGYFLEREPGGRGLTL
ncbi:MAG: prepilin-type N-terminal cleavage/methylation domain-containing protein, partial [Deltaproteobacteria bacterium]|nr:prepilin-type N-terminal cleavage/methylation domain-containing protein [Deltaproteobacteria bacterium]